MSERPEWMPSEGEVFMVRAVDNHDGGQEPSAEDIELICKITGLRAQIAVLEESMDRMKAHLGLLQNAEVRYAYELLRDRRDALRKELEHG